MYVICLILRIHVVNSMIYTYLNALGLREPAGFLAREWTLWKALEVSFTNQFLAYPTLTAVVSITCEDSILDTHNYVNGI